MRPIDADAIKLPRRFFEEVDNVPKFYDWLDKQPTIEAEPKWTLCTEALPVTEDYVLCTTEKKNGDRSVVRGYYTGSAWACGMNSNVVAWMPLPEPYKEGQAHGDACEKSTADVVSVRIPIVAMGDGGGDRVLLLCDTSKASYEDALYPCDPSKNTECRKTGCFKNGGPCSSTRHAEYAAGEGTEEIMPNKKKIDPKEWQSRYCVECVYAPDCAGFGVMKNACRGFEPRVRKDKKESEQR